MRARDDLHADDFADGARGLRAGISRGFHRGDITNDDGGDERIADLLHRTGERNVGGLEHGIDASDERGEPARFEKTNRFGGHKVEELELVVESRERN